MYSITKKMKKILFPECTGHFTLSPFLTHLPISVLFKHMPQLCDHFPLPVFLFFKDEELTNCPTLSDIPMIPPASLIKKLVMVQDKVLETSLIISPHLEDASLDLSNSENLINLVIDKRFGALEVLVKDIRDPMEKKKLYNDTCLIHETINFLKVKYYYESVSHLVYNTQIYLYAKCQTKWRTGIKMDLPSWTSTPNRRSNVCV